VRLEVQRARLLEERDAAEVLARNLSTGAVAALVPGGNGSGKAPPEFESSAESMELAGKSRRPAREPKTIEAGIDFLVDRPVDSREMLMEATAWWQSVGMRALRKKAGRGDLRALAQMTATTRLLFDIDKANDSNCSRPCCQPEVKPRAHVVARPGWP
jgi:hypothetical protein